MKQCDLRLSSHFFCAWTKESLKAVQRKGMREKWENKAQSKERRAIHGGLDREKEFTKNKLLPIMIDYTTPEIGGIRTRYYTPNCTIAGHNISRQLSSLEGKRGMKDKP